MTDKGLINTGIAAKISVFPVYFQMRYLRYFPEGKKNCYTLKPQQGRNNKYLIRALFQYGNYDHKREYPTFDLLVGVNKWETIRVQGSVTRYIWTEIIHIPSTDYIDVCLVNIGHGIPFISALELRLLTSFNYWNGSESVVFHQRENVGSTDGVAVRYKDDVDDRIWKPRNPNQEFPDWDPITANSTIDPWITSNAYSAPPAKVLMTAAISRNLSTPLSYNSRPDNFINFEYYVFFHFAGIDKLARNQKREISISSNGVTLEEAFTLDYLRPLTKGPYKLQKKEDGFVFCIKATERSNLPPLLNAFEIFKTITLPDSPTFSEDVDAIIDIKQRYGVTRNWQGDPCLPINTSWEGLDCSKDNPPRILSLNLTSSKLTGEIPTSLSNLGALKFLDLSFNMLTGPIPDFLAELPFLEVINLTGNNLTGSVPRPLLEKAKLHNLFLSVQDNPNLCLSAARRAKKGNLISLVASLISALLLSFLALAIWRFFNRKQRDLILLDNFTDINEKQHANSNIQNFTYSQVESITNNFEAVIGGGGFGKVYRGTLRNGKAVAIKLLSPLSKQGPKEFNYEVKLLTRAHHGNLVSLIGYCDDGKNLALAYEYMANGNLRQHLSESSKNVLDWKQRIQIAVDVAQGLDYLHNGCKPSIIHRDLKTSNILLNDNWQAKIADFGLSRDFKNENDTHITTVPAGTPAYMDPEILAYGNKKNDVYSYGIVLLELITGQPAVMEDSDYTHITNWVRTEIKTGDIHNIVDQRLQGAFDVSSAWKAVDIANSCIRSSATQRPDMGQVVMELK